MKLLFLILISFQLHAQVISIPYLKDGKYFLADSLGNITGEQNYDQALLINDGLLIAVEKNLQIELIGQQISGAPFGDYIPEGFIAVEKNRGSLPYLVHVEKNIQFSATR